jgi:hypothetical protein
VGDNAGRLRSESTNHGSLAAGLLACGSFPGYVPPAELAAAKTRFGARRGTILAVLEQAFPIVGSLAAHPSGTVCDCCGRAHLELLSEIDLLKGGPIRVGWPCGVGGCFGQASHILTHPLPQFCIVSQHRFHQVIQEMRLAALMGCSSGSRTGKSCEIP